MILYVDDDSSVLTSRTRFLNTRGHLVKGANNGQQGLEVLAGDDGIQIICTDFNMPVMDGYAFSKAVKTDPKYVKHARVPIIGVGAFPVNMQEHLVACIPKSYDPQKLLETIEQLCK